MATELPAQTPGAPFKVCLLEQPERRLWGRLAFCKWEVVSLASGTAQPIGHVSGSHRCTGTEKLETTLRCLFGWLPFESCIYKLYSRYWILLRVLGFNKNSWRLFNDEQLMQLIVGHEKPFQITSCCYCCCCMSYHHGGNSWQAQLGLVGVWGARGKGKKEPGYDKRGKWWNKKRQWKVQSDRTGNIITLSPCLVRQSCGQ